MSVWNGSPVGMWGAKTAAHGEAVCGAISRKIIEALDLTFQLVVDFFLPDRCILCKRLRYGPEKPRGNSCGPEEAVLRPVKLDFGPVRLINHPLCSKCGDSLERARRGSVIGYILEDDSILISRGERFWSGITGCAPAGIQSGSGANERPLRVISPFMINDNLLQIVRLFKYRSFTSLSAMIGGSMAGALKTNSPSVSSHSLVVPVPSHDVERKKRGFSHTSIIAAALGGAAGLDLSFSRLVKIRSTRRQSKTPHGQRADNVRGAFRAAGVAGRHILLLDDIVTTGATAGSCASALLSAGAADVKVICFGRAL